MDCSLIQTAGHQHEICGRSGEYGFAPWRGNVCFRLIVTRVSLVDIALTHVSKGLSQLKAMSLMSIRGYVPNVVPVSQFAQRAQFVS
jgi:hypothetical protein